MKKKRFNPKFPSGKCQNKNTPKKNLELSEKKVKRIFTAPNGYKKIDFLSFSLSHNSLDLIMIPMDTNHDINFFLF